MLLPAGQGRRLLPSQLSRTAKPSCWNARPRTRVRCSIAHLQHAVIAPEQPVNEQSTALVPLLGGVRAHESSVSSIIVLDDQKNGSKVVVSSSMDKTIAAWRLSPNQDGSESHPFYCEVQKIPAPGGPIFSMAPTRPLPGQPTPKPTPDGKTPVPIIFCGNAAKEVVSWQPFTPAFSQLKLDGHTGWVRAVASYDKYLFSCGCNYLRQWDCTYATPKELNKVKLFTGDILAITAGTGFVSTAGADGSLRSWSVDKASGAMAETGVKEHAHEGRICGLLRGNGVLYTCGADGAIRMWSQGKLDMVAQALQAHSGEKVRCMAMGGNGVLYTGGDDHLIRAWSPHTLEPLPDFEPLRAHASSVRILSAGKSEILVSGDKEGYINFFQVPQVKLPGPAPQLVDPFAHLFMPAAPTESCDIDLAMPPVVADAPKAASRQQLGGLEVEPAAVPPVPLSATEFDASLQATPTEEAEVATRAAAAAAAAAAAGAAGVDEVASDGSGFAEPLALETVQEEEEAGPAAAGAEAVLSEVATAEATVPPPGAAAAVEAAGAVPEQGAPHVQVTPEQAAAAITEAAVAVLSDVAEAAASLQQLQQQQQLQAVLTGQQALDHGALEQAAVEMAASAQGFFEQAAADEGVSEEGPLEQGASEHDTQAAAHEQGQVEAPSEPLMQAVADVEHAQVPEQPGSVQAAQVQAHLGPVQEAEGAAQAQQRSDVVFG